MQLFQQQFDDTPDERARLESGDVFNTCSTATCCCVQKSPSTAKLQKLHTERSAAMLQVISYMSKVRGRGEQHNV